MYSWSKDEEWFEGQFETREQAALEAAKMYSVFWTGKNRKPASPESFWFAEDWLEAVSVSEDYSLEQAVDWDESTKEQREELEIEVREVMRRWLERHQLNPRFWHVEEIERHETVLTPELGFE